ncbi:hypothetical protein EL75_4694 [Escherichia coli]|nr:hypothetical protein EL75_4694 [Escherichia coli]
MNAEYISRGVAETDKLMSDSEENTPVAPCIS